METMDLSTSQEVMGVKSRYEYVFKPKENFEETDIQGDINLFNTLKTEANSNHDSSPLFQVKCLNENKFEVDNDLFSYSSFRKAMDLRTHNRTPDGVKRTIFDDAEYFAKNYCYKLLPITLEPVDETVIQSEHNYSLIPLNSESESEENCSRTMDYSQVKEKNYKKRKTQVSDGSEDDVELNERDTNNIATDNHYPSSKQNPEDQNGDESALETQSSPSVQPLDLSAAPPVQEEKTDSYLNESLSSIVENYEVAHLDSDKENVISELNGVLVTISRPDEKENYEPCDLFLNDIARLVPRLIDKDCVEVDILDRTCDRHDEFRKHRLYYVISESTWRLFQKTNERVILTNDQSLGQPLQKAEKEERPSYLVFDQFSLAKCLADYCQEIGGCFEYTCVEEEKEEANLNKEEEEKRKTCLTESVTETEPEITKTEETVEENVDKDPKEIPEVSEASKSVADLIETPPEKLEEEIKEAKQNSEAEETSPKESDDPKEEKPTESILPPPESENTPNKTDETKEKPPDREIVKKKKADPPKQANPKTLVGKRKEKVKKEPRGTKRRSQSSIQRKPKNPRTTSTSKSTSELETSQKSNKPVSRKGRRVPIHSDEEPPNKAIKKSIPEVPPRKTRSGKVLLESKTKKPIEKKKEDKGSTKRNVTQEKKTEETGRSLRSQKSTQWKEKVQVLSKGKVRKR